MILIAALVSAIPVSAATGADYATGNGWFYTQTGGGSGQGYSVLDSGTDSSGHTVVDVLHDPHGEAVIGTCATQLLMKQSTTAMPRLKELFRLEDKEEALLLNAQRGEGLIFAEGKRVMVEVVASAEEARLIERATPGHEASA